jgi:acetyl-CoA carboxylase biotin carboxyl carrier protein
MNHEQIEAVVDVLRESSRLTELEVRFNGTVLRVRRPAPPEPTARPSRSTALAPHAAVARTNGENATNALTVLPTERTMDRFPALVTVTAQIVGVFRAQRPPVQVGDVVTEKQVLGQIEAMRLMNDCTATSGGEIFAILVSDGQPVEYGQPLFEIVPTSAEEA